MTRKQHRKDKQRRLELKNQEPELTYKPEECDPEADEAKFQAWRKGFLRTLKEEVFSQAGQRQFCY